MAAKTVVTYTLNGVIREFDFTFDYLSRTFVQVTLIGTINRVLIQGTGYTFITNQRIRLSNTAGPPLYTAIEIRRVTSVTERLVNFQDASILRAADLNMADLQVLHVAEEAREATTETISTNAEGNLDARGRRIVNLGAPVSGSDAVSLSYYKSDTIGAYNSRVAAEAARDAAQAWASASGQPATGYESARTYAMQAFGYQNTANSASVAAQGFASSAASAATNATNSSTSASTFSLQSKAWATTVENTVVTGGEYSSLHWAAKSKKWASNPVGAEVNGAGSGYSALHWAAYAQTQAGNASTSATTASQWSEKTDGPVTGSLYSARYWSGRAKDWAEKTDGQVVAGEGYSAKYWSSWSQTWAEKIDGPVSGTAYSARFWSTQSQSWANNSDTSRILASQWAQKTDGQVVAGEGYSAKYWAQQAAAAAGGINPSMAAAIKKLFEDQIGVPIPWPATGALPAGYVAMEGQSISSIYPILRSRYPTYVLPDMRNQFIRGLPASGRVLLSTQADAIRSHSHTGSGTTSSVADHTHTVTDPGHKHDGVSAYPTKVSYASIGTGADNYPAFGGTLAVAPSATTGISLGGAGAHSHTFSLTTSSTGDTETRPANIAFRYICMTDAAVPVFS